MYRTGFFAPLTLAALLAACTGGGDAGTGIPDPDSIPAPVAPTAVTLVTDGDQAGFQSPLDAVASHDGQRFFFSAYTSTPAEDQQSAATIYAVPAAGGDPEVLHSGDPLDEPTGLVMSCDGKSLYIADIGHRAGDGEAPLYKLDIKSKTLSPLPADGIGEAASLALSSDCERLYATGYASDGTPALFRIPPQGGAASIVKQGAPLVRPTGVYVDVDNVAWVMDQQPKGEAGGVLFAIAEDGTTQTVIDGLNLSEPAGVSLVAGGEIAVIPTRDDDQRSQLLTVEIATGEMTVVDAPELIEPAGIRTAIASSVLVVVDADGHAIYKAE